MDTDRTSVDDQSPGPALSRRAFFGRVALVAGGGATLLGLTGCPGGDGDDDDDDDDDD